MKTLGNILDNKTLETFTKAEQLDTDLSELNELIEGKLVFYSFSILFFLFCLIPLSPPNTNFLRIYSI